MLKFLFILISFLSFLTIRAQQVTNIQVTQEGDNVVITYDILSDNAGQAFDIKVECSTDGGKTFSILPKALTGDLKGIKAGYGKEIVWDVLSEGQELAGDQFVFQLLLVENYAGNSGTFTDDRDGHVYKWVKIGTQIWMAENLAFLPSVSPITERSVTNPFYYVYDYNGISVSEAKASEKYKTYGTLYNYPAAKQACPIGWHLPSDNEWDILVSLLGGNNTAGSKMKLITGWKSKNNIEEANSEFAGLPGGSLDEAGLFEIRGYMGYWWSSSELGASEVWSIRLNIENVRVKQYDKRVGFSVRCVKNY